MRRLPPGLLLVLLVLPGAAAEGPSWLAADVGAPYVVLAEDEEGAPEVGTLQFLVVEDRGSLLRVRVRATDEVLAQLFGAGDYVVARGTGEVVERADQSLAAVGQRLGWWLDPAGLPGGNGTVPLLGSEFRVRGPEEREGVEVLVLAGRSFLDVEEERKTFLVARAYRAQDGLLHSVEVRRDVPGEAQGTPLLRVDLAAAGPVAGALPPELATFALLGPATFAAAFGAMLLARRRYRTVALVRPGGFCARCGSPLGAGPACPRCGTPRGAA